MYSVTDTILQLKKKDQVSLSRYFIQSIKLLIIVDNTQGYLFLSTTTTTLVYFEYRIQHILSIHLFLFFYDPYFRYEQSTRFLVNLSFLRIRRIIIIDRFTLLAYTF